MKRLIELCKKEGWHFAIWLVPTNNIIQGSPDDDWSDWAFDVQAPTLDEAIAKALAAIEAAREG